MPVLLNRFAEIATKLFTGVEVAEKDARRHLLEEAQRRAPVLSGALRDSGHIEGDRVVFDAVNEQGDPYGAFAEFGTSDTPAQPFVRPAAEETRNTLARDLLAVVRRL